jgi:hypothetical protein
MARKTINVDDVKQMINDHLARTDKFATADFKAAMCTIADNVLFDGGNYRGFSFLNGEDTETGTVGFYSRKYL